MKNIKKRLDRLVGQKVRSRGKCERCLKKLTLGEAQWCHIMTRRILLLRWDMENALCLCGACHEFFDNHKEIFYKWLDMNYPGRLDYLFRRKNDVIKVNDVWLEDLYKLLYLI